jgi:hypothetical protein
MARVIRIMRDEEVVLPSKAGSSLSISVRCPPALQTRQSLRGRGRAEFVEFVELVELLEFIELLELVEFIEFVGRTCWPPELPPSGALVRH